MATMLPQPLLPALPGLHARDSTITPRAVVVEADTTAPAAFRPHCRVASTRAHSRYTRALTDRPLAGTPLLLRRTVRRFACRTPGGPRTVFAEPITDPAPPRPRTTADLAAAHTALGFAAGGEPGSRPAAALAMPTRPDTLPRRVNAAAADPGPPPRSVGVDDGAGPEGPHYGAIAIDLERGRVIDLLPGRGGEAPAAWRRENPQVEVLTRDRWPAYAKAATAAAPQGTPVADRWHLLKNLREAGEHVPARPGPELRATITPGDVPVPSPPPADGPAVPPGPSAPEPAPSAGAAARGAKRQARRDRHQRVRTLGAEGHPLRDIARHLGMSPTTVLRGLRQPDRPHGDIGRRGPTARDPHRGGINSWLSAGGANTADLYRVRRATGCRAPYDAVRGYANRRLGRAGQPGRRPGAVARPPPAPEVPPARKLSVQFACPRAREEADGPSFLDRVRGRVPGWAAALDRAGELAGMIRRTVTTPRADGLGKAAAGGVPELAGFAAGLRADEAAVSAARTGPLLHGPVEGQVNRRKAIKRSMSGRAGMALRRARVMHKG